MKLRVGTCHHFELASLPPRERELKRGQFSLFVSVGKSLPPRERELKHCLKSSFGASALSLPPRERELKPYKSANHPPEDGRSPRGSVN